MIPKVAIIGRPNVGKSSLLNLLSERTISIVEPTAGVTRDRVVATCELPPDQRGEPPRFVDLVDTGGYGIEDSQGLTKDVERQIANAMAEADLILFVIDSQEGITPLDNQVARLLRMSKGHGIKVPVLLIANKVDGETHEAHAHIAQRLGFGEPVMVSAKSQHNKFVLINAIRNAIQWDKFAGALAPPDPGMLLSIVGKRNAGKSTFVNQLAGDDRVIVSEVEGTTRDSIDVRFEMDGKVFTAIDTAGVRKGKSIQDDIEYYSLHRSLRAVRRSDVCLFMIDATLPISSVDHKLGNEIIKHHKPTILVINKWDLAEKKATKEAFIKYLETEMMGFSFAPVAFISAKEGEGIKDVIQTALNLYAQAGTRVSTSEMNKVMDELLAERTPISGVGRRPKIYYATQLAVHPPTIGVFVNAEHLFDHNYQRFLLNRFRDLLPFPEVPIKLIIRGKDNAPEDSPTKQKVEIVKPKGKGPAKSPGKFRGTSGQSKEEKAREQRQKRDRHM
jgi:GTPase